MTAHSPGTNLGEDRRAAARQPAGDDPPTFGAVILLIAGVSLLACYLPGRRAARLDAARALRTS